MRIAIVCKATNFICYTYKDIDKISNGKENPNSDLQRYSHGGIADVLSQAYDQPESPIGRIMVMTSKAILKITTKEAEFFLSRQPFRLGIDVLENIKYCYRQRPWHLQRQSV